MIRRLALLGVLVFGAVAAAAESPAFKGGNWWLGYGRGPINHQPLMIVKAETKDGKTTAEKVAVPAKSSFELASYSIEIMPGNFTDLSAFSTPATSRTPLPKTTSVFFSLS